MDEMISETDVDDTQCSEYIVDIRPLKLFTTFHHSVCWNEPSHRSSTCKHHKWWRRSSEFLKITQRVENTQDKPQNVSRQEKTANSRTSCGRTGPASRKPLEVKKHKITKTDVQRRNPIIQDKGQSRDQAGRDFPDSAHSTFQSRRNNGCSNRYQRHRRCKRLLRCRV